MIKIKSHVNKLETPKFSPSNMVKCALESHDSSWLRIIHNHQNTANKMYPAGECRSHFDAATMALLGDRTKTCVLRYLNIAKDCGRYHWQLSHLPEQLEIELVVDGLLFVFETKATRSYQDFDFWLKCFTLALILRDKPAQQELQAFSETVFDNVEVESDPFDRALFAFIKGMFSADADKSALLQAALTASAPEYLTELRQAYAYQILLPLLEIAAAILSPNGEMGYHAAMQKACESHKQYWLQQPMAKGGWCSLPLTAFAALAFDQRGWRTNIDSDYIPDWLVTGDFED